MVECTIPGRTTCRKVWVSEVQKKTVNCVRYEKEVIRKRVPYTVCRWETKQIVKPVTYRVCRMVKETQKRTR